MIKTILVIGGVGCFIFTGFLLFMAYSGIAAAMRDEEGNFKKELNFKSILGAIMFVGFLLGILLAANMNYIQSQTASPTFIQLWCNSLGVFFVIHLYDLLVLDYLIIVKWNPRFLNLPNTGYYNTMRPHIKGFFKGIPIGVIASLISSLIAFGML